MLYGFFIPVDLSFLIIWMSPIVVLELFADGWLTCDFTSILTVFQSYQDNVKVIMKGRVQWNLLYGWKDFCVKQGLTLVLLDQ